MLPDCMENRNSHPNTKTRKGPDVGGKFSSDRTPLHSRQSSRENYIKQGCLCSGDFELRYPEIPGIVVQKE
ncbi:hypothetical protein TNCV_1231161 [Trichonephila clavipes]|nr:hypothetical protein TNCV_1231161 [Trichonephila clavipes]